MKFLKALLIVLSLTLGMGACSPATTPAETDTPGLITVIPNKSTPVLSTVTPSPSATMTLTPTPTPGKTATPLPSETFTLVPTATNTETLREKLKTHIVFYLIIPEGKRRDACGEIKEVPIISKRMRTNDKLQDVQIALEMLFSIGSKYYGPYYNALWDTQFSIEATEYNPKKDYMTITFGGYFPFTSLSDCDKHGIRQQIWTTFFHYGFKEKTFKYYDKYLIDRLGGH
jgi:hypothetical protein